MGLKINEPLYLKNQAKLKIYGDTMYKLVRFKSLLNSNVESDLPRTYNQKGTINDTKLDNNISRAKSKVKEYVLCNPWEYFGTFTIDKTKYDRYDLELYHKTVSQWLRNINKKYKTNIKYILIPEKHEDGAWHEHGFFLGIPKEQLRLFTLEEKLPYYIRDKLIKGYKIYDWTLYRNKFGFNDFEPIQNLDAAANYVMKYITKDISRTVNEINAHIYYCSKGLKTAKTIKKGTMSANIEPDFINDYIAINEFPVKTTPTELIQDIIESIT